MIPAMTGRGCGSARLIGLMAACVAAQTAPAAPAALMASTPAAPISPVAPTAQIAPPSAATPTPRTAGLPTIATPPGAAAKTCLATGDGYLRARLSGAIEAKIDWPNSGTRCQGEAKREPAGIRMSFQRVAGAKPDLLFVFGITGVRQGLEAHEAGTNLTVIVQGTNKIFGTLGDSRCTVDSLKQAPLPAPGSFRIEARGFCTQPAHAVRGPGAVLMSTFEFAGLVTYEYQG